MDETLRLTSSWQSLIGKCYAEKNVSLDFSLCALLTMLLKLDFKLTAAMRVQGGSGGCLQAQQAVSQCNIDPPRSKFMSLYSICATRLFFRETKALEQSQDIDDENKRKRRECSVWC